MSNLTKESMQFIIGRLLERAKESVEESNSDPENEFQLQIPLNRRADSAGSGVSIPM